MSDSLLFRVHAVQRMFERNVSVKWVKEAVHHGVPVEDYSSEMPEPGLTKYYGTRRAIDNLTFTTEKGEILGFLGTNGAGKTTTMRILTGYLPPSDGVAKDAGFDVVDQSMEVRKRVGYLPETVPLYPDMTVFDYLKFMADLRHIKNSVERVNQVLESVQMQTRAKGYIANLSRGMRQRVGLAQALIHEPEVLILDEPTLA